YPYSKKDVAPRLAVAYAPNPKTAIRGGFGLFYDLFGSGLMRSQDATAFGLSTALTNPSAVLSVATAPRFTSITTLPQEVMLPDPGAHFPSVYPNAFAITNGIDDKLQAPY